MTDSFSYRYNLGNLTLSDNNRLTAVGCNTYAFLTISDIEIYSTGCISVCDAPPATKQPCTGEVVARSLPLEGTTISKSKPFRLRNDTNAYSFNPCSYAFLAESGTFDFHGEEDLMNLRNFTDFPVVLDWSLGKQTCEQVGNTSLCGGNSICSNSTTSIGYICKCKDGYTGNPYLSNGCQGTSTCLLLITCVNSFSDAFLVASCGLFTCPDIDECSSPVSKHNCTDPKTCKNTMGSFHCNCPSGYLLNSLVTCAPNDTPRDTPEKKGWTAILLGKLPTVFYSMKQPILIISVSVRCNQEPPSASWSSCLAHAV